MDQLFKLKDTFIAYLSPNKRRRTVGPITPSLGPAQRSYEPISEPQDKKALATLRAKVNQKSFSPSDTRFAAGSRKRAREDDNDIEDEASEVSPEESVSQITPVEESGEESVNSRSSEGEEHSEMSLEEEMEEEVEVSPEDKVEEYLARQAELALRKEAIADVKAQGTWHPEEIFLFERLSMRSFEELLPATWQIDFPTLPEILFTPIQEKTFINYNYGSSCYGKLTWNLCNEIKLTTELGVKALQSLLNLGGRVKDKIEAGRPCERLIAKEIQRYIKWSERDGGFNKMRFIPVLTVVAARHKEAIASISKSITDQMEFLAEKHRESLALAKPRTDERGELNLYSRRPPLLYGIIVAQTMTIFVTLDSSDPQARLRHVSHFDFKEKNVDVWNGVALAIIVIVARNYLMSIKDEFEVDDASSSDPDA
jgi:hypothetical protein